jgi:hypothetical protein
MDEVDFTSLLQVMRNKAFIPSWKEDFGITTTPDFVDNASGKAYSTLPVER